MLLFFQVGDFNTKKLQGKINLKKNIIQNNIKTFFNKFSQTNKLIFSKLLDTVHNEENNIMGSLKDLTRRINLYLGEEIIINGQDGKIQNYPKSNINFRNKAAQKKK